MDGGSTHGRHAVGEETDAYESHWYRVMRAMASDPEAEDDAAEEADAARRDHSNGHVEPDLVVSVAGDRVPG